MSTHAARRLPSARTAVAGVVLALVAFTLTPINLLGATVTGGETCQALSPNYRAADTRNAPLVKLGGGQTMNVQVTGVGGVPIDATTVKVQLTATDLVASSGESFLTMYPAGTGQPSTSNLNPISEHTTTNGAQPVAVGAGGEISIYNNVGSTHVIVDVVEWCDQHNHDDRYYTRSQVDDLIAAGGGSGGVTHVPFEVRLSFDASQTVGEVGDIQLSLRCRRTDPENPTVSDQSRATLQARGFSFDPFLTTAQAGEGIYSGGTGVTIERALGSSADDQPVQTSFLNRDSGAAAITGGDGSQISMNGDAIQVAFHHQGADCYARGFVSILQPRVG